MRGSLFARPEDGEEGLLRDLHAADALHALLARLLLLEELALPRDVAAVTLREHVLAQRPDGLTGDHLRAHGRLHRHVEQLSRDELAELVDQQPPLAGRPVAM